MSVDSVDTSTRARRRTRLTKLVAVRLSLENVAFIGMMRPRLSRNWHEATMSDVLRSLIIRGLEVMAGLSISEQGVRLVLHAEPRGRGSKSKHVAVRLRSEEIVLVDAQRESLRAEFPSATLSDVLRLLIREGIAADDTV